MATGNSWRFCGPVSLQGELTGAPVQSLTFPHYHWIMVTINMERDGSCCSQFALSDALVLMFFSVNHVTTLKKLFNVGCFFFPHTLATFGNLCCTHAHHLHPFPQKSTRESQAFFKLLLNICSMERLVIQTDKPV